MRSLKVKEQEIFYRHLKQNVSWLCLDWPSQCFLKKMFNTLLATSPFYRIGMGHGKGPLSVSRGMPRDLWMNF